MTFAETNFLTRQTQLFPLSMGGALATIARTLWPHHTAKFVQSEWGADPNTAKNVVKAAAGAVVVTHAVQEQQKKHKNGWALWDALGELIIGEPRAAFDARVLAAMEEETARVRDTIEARTASRRSMEAGALNLYRLEVGPRHQPLGGGRGADGARPDGLGGEPAEAAPVEPKTFAEPAARTDARQLHGLRRRD